MPTTSISPLFLQLFRAVIDREDSTHGSSLKNIDSNRDQNWIKSGLTGEKRRELGLRMHGSGCLLGTENAIDDFRERHVMPVARKRLRQMFFGGPAKRASRPAEDYRCAIDEQTSEHVLRLTAAAHSDFRIDAGGYDERLPEFGKAVVLGAATVERQPVSTDVWDE
jgi:hypothetical protein